MRGNEELLMKLIMITGFIFIIGLITAICIDLFKF